MKTSIRMITYLIVLAVGIVIGDIGTGIKDNPTLETIAGIVYILVIIMMFIVFPLSILVVIFERRQPQGV